MEAPRNLRKKEPCRSFVLRIGNIQAGRLDWGDLVYTSEPGEIAQYELSAGDVLFNRTNSLSLGRPRSIVENGPRFTQDTSFAFDAANGFSQSFSPTT